MKRKVQILLLSAFLVPALCSAGEETMEERKRRITRKYLRERTEMTYSDEVVPADEAEDEVTDSEKYRDLQVTLKAEEPGVQMPAPAPRPAPRTENRNWLLAEPEEAEDPYADPFSVRDAGDEPEPEDRPAWGEQSESDFYYDTLREETSRRRRFGSAYEQQPAGRSMPQEDSGYPARMPSGEAVPGARPETGGIYDPAVQPEAYSPYYAQPRTAPYSSSGIYSRGTEPQDQRYAVPNAQPGSSGMPTYKSPFARAPEQQPQQTWSGNTPYQSPYRTQYEQRQRQWQQQWGQDDESGRAYRRQDPFQQWQRRSTAPLNPMGDDAYVDEMMPKARR
jgi:hypothetical protein